MKQIKLINGQMITFDPERMIEVPIHESSNVPNKTKLTEFRPLLVEGIENEPGKPFRIKTILQTANIKNQNGRVYSKEILEREAKKYYDTFIKTRRSLGELDHPESSVVSLKNASHLITDMLWEGDNLVGIIEILNTPNGQIAKQLIQDGVQLGISSRGLGTTKSLGEGIEVVNPDFELLAFDLVSNASVPNAQLETMNESVQPEAKLIISQEQAMDVIRKSYDFLLKRSRKTEDEIFEEYGIKE